MNPLKDKLKAGKPILGFMVTVPDASFTAIIANTGIDWIMIDMEHGPIDIATAQQMIVATRGTSCTPLVRVPGIDAKLAKAPLDGGAFGIVFPVVCTAEEARTAVAATQYPPVGVRGVGPIHAATRWGLSMAEYLEKANENILTIALIEDILAVENIEEILAVPGLDVAHIAPYDLSASMGLTGQLEHPDVLKTIETAERAILKSDKALGGLGQNPDNVNAMIKKGYQCFILTHDAALIQSAAANFLDNIKS